MMGPVSHFFHEIGNLVSMQSAAMTAALKPMIDDPGTSEGHQHEAGEPSDGKVFETPHPIWTKSVR